MGAAFLSGLATGFWKDHQELGQMAALERVFNPEILEEERKKKLAGWNKAVKYAFGWAKEEE